MLISSSDAEKVKKNQIIRLKDLINIQIKSIDINKKIIHTSFHSKELNRQFSIIHWLPKMRTLEFRLLDLMVLYQTV